MSFVIELGALYILRKTRFRQSMDGRDYPAGSLVRVEGYSDSALLIWVRGQDWEKPLSVQPKELRPLRTLEALAAQVIDWPE